MNIKWNTIFIRRQTEIQNKTSRKKDHLGHHYNSINRRSDNTGASYVDLWSNTQISPYIECQ